MSKKFLLILFAYLSGLLTMSAKTEKPYFRSNPDTGKYGYQAGFNGKWLTPAVYDYHYGSDFKDNDYAVVKKDGKYTVINSSFTQVIPDWVEDISIYNGLILARKDNRYKLYDMSGKLMLSADFIQAIIVNQNSSRDNKEHPYKRHLVGFSVRRRSSEPYYFYDVNGKQSMDFGTLSSDTPILCYGGLVLFTKKPRYDIVKGTVTNLMGEVVDNISGHAQLMYIGGGTGITSERVITENLYDGFYPAYVLEATSNYKGKGRGLVCGKEIVKMSGFKFTSSFEEKKKKGAEKVMRQPEMVALYMEKVVKPMLERIHKNEALFANIPTQPDTKKAQIIKFGNGYAFSTNGSTPIVSNTKCYESIEPIGSEGLLLGTINADKAELLSGSGVPVVSNDDYVDFSNIDKGGKYIAAYRKEGKVDLLASSGNTVTSYHDDIIVMDTQIGEVFYFVRGSRWHAWAPGFKNSTPVMNEYHYVGLPDRNGVVEIKYNGYSGTFNLKTGEEISPEKALFKKAYDDNSPLSDAERVKLYHQVIALDSDLREGYKGAALNNIGAIYEDAGDEDTAYSYYERSKNAGNKTGENNYKRIRNNRRLDRIAAVANAVAGATQSALNAMGGGVALGNYDAQYNTGYGDVSSFNSSSTSSSGSGYSASFYQEQYNNWERRAQQAYESLTLLGSKTKKNGMETSGSTGSSMSGSNYTRQKKCLRDAQREMQSIRQKARRDGVTISQSHWENVTVSY